MKSIISFINEYGLSLIHSIAAIIISYISLQVKKILEKHTNDKTKKEVINMVCKAINQLYPNECGQNKLNLAITNAKQILAEKGIDISDLELRMYIESAVCNIKKIKE